MILVYPDVFHRGFGKYWTIISLLLRCNTKNEPLWESAKNSSYRSTPTIVAGMFVRAARAAYGPPEAEILSAFSSTSQDFARTLASVNRQGR